MKFPSHLNCDGKIVSEMGPWIHKNTPYVTGEVWGVFCEYFCENWARYYGTTLYLSLGL